MKIRLALALFLVFILAITALGCSKVTGGGWAYDKLTEEPAKDYPGSKITFALNIQPVKWVNESIVTAAGNFQLNDHSQNIAVHGTSGKLDEQINFQLWHSVYSGGWEGWECWELGAWDCTVNGKGEYYLSALIWLYEGEYDSAQIWVYENGSIAYKWEVWELQKGSIKIHDKK